MRYGLSEQKYIYEADLVFENEIALQKTTFSIFSELGGELLYRTRHGTFSKLKRLNFAKSFN